MDMIDLKITTPVFLLIQRLQKYETKVLFYIIFDYSSLLYINSYTYKMN